LFLIFGAIISMVIFFAQCMNPDKAPATEKTYAGAATCRQCHAVIVDTYLENPHQQTSGPVKDDKIISGPMPYSSVYTFDNHLKLIVEKRDGKMFQVVYDDGKERLSRPFDIKIGSGEKAHTYGAGQTALDILRTKFTWIAR
jgi:hypothetical protein